MKKYALFDLDGCLSDDEWRLDDLAAGNFDIYHSKLDRDEVMNRTHFMHSINAGKVPVFITARPERYRDATTTWINNKLFDGEYVLLMRPDGDHQASPDVKVMLLQDQEILPREVDVAFDDRIDVLSAYKNFGIESCIQLSRNFYAPVEVPTDSKKARSHYMKEYKGIKLDPARICKVYGQTDILMTTIVKKALAAGERGHKDFRQDLIDIISAAERRLEMMDEDGE